MRSVHVKIVESLKCRGKWKGWIIAQDGRSGFFQNGHAFRTRLAVERAIQRAYEAEGIAVDFHS